MERIDKNEEMVSRRAFLKKTVKILPVIAGVSLGMGLLSSCEKDGSSSGCSGCTSDCSGSCSTVCGGSCSGSCTGRCSGLSW